MEAQVITSRDNQFVKKCIKLFSSAKERRESGLFCLEGVRLCEDAVRSGIRFNALVVSFFAREKYADSINFLEDFTEKLYHVSDGVFKSIADTATPQGIIGIAEIPDNNNKINTNGKYIALENIQDPSNLGAVSRSAEAFGISGLILSRDCCDPYSPKALRASMGALVRIPVIIAEDIIPFLKASSIKSFACVVNKDAEKINGVSFPEGSAAIIGNEGNGLRETTVSGADNRITIPMSGRAESLNAAVAASIVIWEMQRKCQC